ncbi:peptidoglycan DD-metalloendopeptidase family protein [Thiomicrorhabdus sp. ZW0627]|uniref:M23 family metallopeptidase n=1 Tax=Thiomicrorhabdus sp. ZW0627 TaxID=3039774 RepID=UPI002436AD27|nr:peptidoglycan DD-metalloendopeptidase family protein [Thiomicrorhabdus sp. ZW0627]MDG6774809.1 peptidoglycan DD-metalloendopeptidase family protein [Thiomicrorhabdus sp. ZW0627]
MPLPPVDQEAESVDVQSVRSFSEQDWQKHVVKIPKNGSLGGALASVNVPASITYQIGKLKNSNLLTNLRAGDTLTIWIDKHDNLQKILYPKSKTLRYELHKQGEQYQIQTIEEPIQIRTEIATGTISDSFYLDGKKAGLSAKSIMNLADIFAWDIDFIRELRPGDTFKVIYETRYLNNEYIGDGNIIAAQVTTNNKHETHNAFLLKDGDKIIGYYNEQGKNLKKAFLRNPVDYVRITSRFQPKRYHPVLQKWRAHRGVDYGGPIGTPIHVTGNGKIVFRGWGHGYGNYIKVQHAGKYMTVYGHMSKFGKFKKGSWVKQGDIIGYIGKTGLATGPHLHYEFRINGKHQDPLKMKFPAAQPVAKKYATEFKKQSHLMLSQLDRLSTDLRMASFE